MTLAFVGNKLDLENDPETPRVISTEVERLPSPSRLTPCSKGRHMPTRRE
jgi:hypothetical protein